MDFLPKVDMSEAEAKPDPEPAREVQEVVEDTPLPQPVKPPTLEVSDIFDDDKPAVKPKKPKKIMSEKQLETLAKARAKGLETRRRKAKERAELKDLEKQAKAKKKSDLKSYVSGEDPAEKPRVKPVVSFVEPKQQPQDFVSMTQSAIKSALEQHDEERRVRKSKKKAIQEDQVHKHNLHQLVNSTTARQKRHTDFRLGDAGFYSHLF